MALQLVIEQGGILEHDAAESKSRAPPSGTRTKGASTNVYY